MSETPIAVIVDCSTKEVTERPLTAEEIAQREADAAAAAAAEAEREAEEAARLAAIAKLEALGLTAEEATALIG
jgi:hypothetical protein